MKVHTLKCWLDEFWAIIDKTKTFEYRKNDRDFQVGDTLRLREFLPTAGIETNRTAYAKVTYILKNKPEFGLPEDYCVMQIEFLGTKREEE